jgi:hypothetical protein
VLLVEEAVAHAKAAISSGDAQLERAVQAACERSAVMRARVLSLFDGWEEVEGGHGRSLNAWIPPMGLYHAGPPPDPAQRAVSGS